MVLRILHGIGLLCTFYLAETSATLSPRAIRHCQSYGLLYVDSDVAYSLAKEEQPDSSFPHSNSSFAMGTIMYVPSNSRTAIVFRVSQLALVSVPSRYVVIEDFGPNIFHRADWPGFVVTVLPQILGCMAVGIFNGALLVRIYLVESLSYAYGPQSWRWLIIGE
jgi:hypothetical protein